MKPQYNKNNNYFYYIVSLFTPEMLNDIHDI